MSRRAACGTRLLVLPRGSPHAKAQSPVLVPKCPSQLSMQRQEWGFHGPKWCPKGCRRAATQEPGQRLHQRRQVFCPDASKVTMGLGYDRCHWRIHIHSVSRYLAKKIVHPQKSILFFFSYTSPFFVLGGGKELLGNFLTNHNCFYKSSYRGVYHSPPPFNVSKCP